MSVRVRMAPSPTGFLHIGGVRTFLFNWLFARGRGGECLLRIENTDTSREVAEATEQIQRSLAWLGIDWDGPVTFQLDAMDRCRELAQRLLAEGRAYEDEGAVRFRMPDEGVTAWDDAVLGRIEVPNEKLEDVVLVRSDGRPTYNFASPVEDMDDAITHVIRGRDHISNTPKQLQILRRARTRASGLRARAGRPRRRRQEAVEAPRRDVDRRVPRGRLHPAGADELPRAARLGARRRDDDHGAGRARGAVHARARRRQPGDARLPEARLDERRLPAGAPARGVRATRWSPTSASRATTGPKSASARPRRSSRRRSSGSASSPSSPASSSHAGTAATRTPSTRDVLAAAEDTLAGLEPFTAEAIEQALRDLAERLGQKPRQAFQPIRVAVTGSNVSPGLFESIELLGRDETLARIRDARAAAR